MTSTSEPQARGGISPEEERARQKMKTSLYLVAFFILFATVLFPIASAKFRVFALDREEAACLAESKGAIVSDISDVASPSLVRFFNARLVALEAMSHGDAIPEDSMRYALPEVDASNADSFCQAVDDLAIEVAENAAANRPS